MPDPLNKKKVRLLLTDARRDLAGAIESTDSEGVAITKASVLAETVWDNAIGVEKFDPQTGKRTTIKPQQWAIQLVFDRLEGKVPMMAEDLDNFGPGVADRISELIRDKLNKVAEKHADGDSGN